MQDLDVFQSPFARDIFRQKYSLDGQETWADTARRVVETVCADRLSIAVKQEIYNLIVSRTFIPAGRYLYASGREVHQVNNCVLFRAEDSREGWADLGSKVFASLMLGAGIGVEYSDLREDGALVRRTGGRATGPIALMHAVNEIGRQVMQGGARRSAIWAGLNWRHPDIYRFLGLKNHSQDMREAKSRDISFPLPMELTNISVGYDRAFFEAYDAGDAHARQVWQQNCLQAFSTAEPGFSFNYCNARESLRNACTEIVSEDDSDRCNLGTVWLPRVKSQADLARVCELAVAFLLCGSVYSDVPTEKIREVGSRNNRIGLGLGGFYEWLAVRGHDYEVTPELHGWLATYADSSSEASRRWADRLGVAAPIGIRAIAPNGTLGIIAETTTGIEPLFCAAYKRRYYKDGRWHYQLVVDGAAKRLLTQGVPLEVIERNDAYTLQFEQRVRFQADVQDYVDQAISSTANMDQWGSESNNEGNAAEKARVLYRYAPRLRGFTTYPDGCRSGQPLTKVGLREALANEGTVYVEEIRECTNGVCGL